MFSVDKKTLQSIYGSVLKLVPKFNEIVVDVKKEGLWLIINVESYIRIFVPAEVKDTGRFKIQKEQFESLFRFRSSVLECSFNKERNILNVDCGTKSEIYISFKVEDAELEEPEITSDNLIQLKSQDVGTFKGNLSCVKFNSPDVEKSEYVYIKNVSDSVILTFGTKNLFARYIFKQPLSDSDFEICIHYEKFRLALSLIESSVEIQLDDRMFKIISDNIVVTLPTLLDETFLGCVTACDNLLEDGVFKKGKLELNLKNVQKITSSVRAIGSGVKGIIFDVKDTRMLCKLQSDTGSAKDKLNITSNTVGNIKFKIPELFVDAAIVMGLAVNENSIMQFGDNEKYWILKQKNKFARLFIVGPIMDNYYEEY